MSQSSERISLVTEEDMLHSRIKTLANPTFGPCSISPDALEALRLALKSHSTGAEPKQVIFALLGELAGDRWRIIRIVQLIGAHTSAAAAYSFHDLRKIEQEAAVQALSFIGLLQSQPDSSKTLQPTLGDKLSFLAMVSEFKRPLFFFIADPQTLEVGWLSISLENFLHLQESVKFETQLR
jgi:hypothetical protein